VGRSIYKSYGGCSLYNLRGSVKWLSKRVWFENSYSGNLVPLMLTSIFPSVFYVSSLKRSKTFTKKRLCLYTSLYFSSPFKYLDKRLKRYFIWIKPRWKQNWSRWKIHSKWTDWISDRLVILKKSYEKLHANRRLRFNFLRVDWTYPWREVTGKTLDNHF